MEVSEVQSCKFCGGYGDRYENVSGDNAREYVAKPCTECGGQGWAIARTRIPPRRPNPDQSIKAAIRAITRAHRKRSRK